MEARISTIGAELLAHSRDIDRSRLHPDGALQPLVHFIFETEAGIDDGDQHRWLRSIFGGLQLLDAVESALALALCRKCHCRERKRLKIVRRKRKRLLMGGDGFVVSAESAQVPAQKHVRPVVAGIQFDALPHLAKCEIVLAGVCLGNAEINIDSGR